MHIAYYIISTATFLLSATMNRHLNFAFLSLFLGVMSLGGVSAFGIPRTEQSTITRSLPTRRQAESHATSYCNANSRHRHGHFNSALHAESDGKTAEVPSSSSSADPAEVIARRIIVAGDVQGGYYRACVKNEVRVDESCKSCELHLFHSFCYFNFCTSMKLR